MKRCPECGREYDNSMKFCLDDGTELLYGPASDEPATAILSSFRVPPSGGSSAESRTQVLAGRPPEGGTLNKNSIAVLPFTNISTEPDNEYFCDGLAEELLNALTKIDGLKVAARASTFSFKEQKTDIGDIASKLGVAHVLDGSVRKSGDRLRVAVQLVNAVDGYHIWSETYDRRMSDIFAVQDEITLAVIDALKLKLLGSAKGSVLERQTENTDAYKAYLKGRYLRYAKNDHHGASLQYEQAIRLDPTHAPSWLALAESYVLRAHYGLLDPREACAKTRDALAKARAIRGDSAEAFYIEGFAAFIQRDWKLWDTAYRRSLEMDPNNSRALGTFGLINCALGNVDEGLALLQRARDSDPLAAYPYAMSGSALVTAGRSSESIPYFEQAFAFEKDNTLAQWCCCLALVALGRFDEGIELIQKAVTVSKRAGFFLGFLGWALACAGRGDEARSILDELRVRPAGSPLALPEACLLAALGDKEGAIDLISRAMDEFTPVAYYVELLCFDSVQDDPRYQDLLKRINHPRASL